MSSCRLHLPAAAERSCLPIEKQRWLFHRGGNHGDAPPSDRAGFMDFVRSLRTSTIYDAVRDARPLTRYRPLQAALQHTAAFRAPGVFRQGCSRSGDALCRFNPVFGQGMSVAAQEAVILDRLLAEDVPMERLARDFFAAIQDTLATPWGVAVSDFVYPATRGVRPADLAQRLQYGMALTKLAAQDPEVHRPDGGSLATAQAAGRVARAGARGARDVYDMTDNAGEAVLPSVSSARSSRCARPAAPVA